MSEGGPSDNEDVEQEVNIQETLEECLERLDRVEEEMFIKFTEPGPEETERRSVWTRHNIKEMWCIYDIRPLLESLAAEERGGRLWFEWLRYVLWGA
jgi:hypothetical protein